MSLKTEFMGLELKNPIIVAAGPWSRNGERIRMALECGAGAVITESIVNEININARPRIAYKGSGMQNIKLYSDIILEEWQQEMKTAKSGGGIVIASVCAQTPSEIAYIAGKAEKFGADAIELGVAAPMGEGLEVITSSPERVYDITARAVGAVSVPVMVKLSQNVANIETVARAAERAGASAISAIDSVRCILGVDLKRRKPLLATYGGYSGAPIKPMGLAAIAAVSQSVRIPTCGVGGISSFEDALEYIMLGATTVQMGSALMLNGFPHIRKLLGDLEGWMAAAGVKTLPELRGAALSGLKSFDEITVEPNTAKLRNACNDTSCLKCVRCCIYGAFQADGGGVSFKAEDCMGCGLCADVCPEGNIGFGWA